MTLVYPRNSATVHPAYDFEDYRSTAKRHPQKPLIIMPHTLSELTGPVYGHNPIGPLRVGPKLLEVAILHAAFRHAAAVVLARQESAG